MWKLESFSLHYEDLGSAKEVLTRPGDQVSGLTFDDREEAYQWYRNWTERQANVAQMVTLRNPENRVVRVDFV